MKIAQRRPLARSVLACLAPPLAALSPSVALGQQAGVSSPGSVPSGSMGQTTRFDSTFNPAVSLSVDFLADYLAAQGESQSGFSTPLRRADVLITDWVDPNAFAWATIAYEGGEVGLDEAVVEYIGLPGNHTLRAGKFFLDFGKQMQLHAEQLRTIDRPLALRAYLGEELGGDGLQYDNWFSVGETTLVRYSVGGFGDLSNEEVLGVASQTVPERKSGTDMGYVARLTAMTDVGTNATLQVGTSARLLPNFTFENADAGLVSEGLSNSVYGVDMTYGWFSKDGVGTWTTGAEVLLFDGSLSARLNDNGTPLDTTDDSLDVLNDTVVGLYWFLEHGWSTRASTGIQYSTIEQPDFGTARAQEFDIYYTRHLSEFLRLRVGGTYATLEGGDDSLRLAVQMTAFLGPHSHGVNW